MTNRKKRERVAFVTGGSGAIGNAICSMLAHDGFAVAIGYYSNGEEAKRTAEVLAESGLKALAVSGDVTDYASIVRAKAYVEKKFGTVDTLVNCAGAEAYKLFGDETAESIRKTIDVDLVGAILACRVFTPDMVSERFGRVVNIASVWGVCGAAMETVYSAAKAGLIGFGKALAFELAPSLVTVNTVSPGYIDTPMNARYTREEKSAILEEIPACRFGLPSDISAVVRFLVQEDASYVTGQNIIVSGGYKNV